MNSVGILSVVTFFFSLIFQMLFLAKPQSLGVGHFEWIIFSHQLYYLTVSFISCSQMYQM